MFKGSQLNSILSILILTAGCHGPEEGPVTTNGKPAAAQPAAEREIPDGLQRAITRVRQETAGRAFSLARSGGQYLANNEAHGLAARFSGDGVRVTALDSRWSVGLRLVKWGYKGAERIVSPGEVKVTRNRLSYLRDGGMEEWYLNGPAGLEQGFKIKRRPAQGAGPLLLHLAISGDVEARMDPGGDAPSVTFHDLEGRMVAAYSDLWVEDAEGREINARMVLGNGLIRLEIQDDGATYPIEVDPLLTGVINKVTTKDGSGADVFGFALSLDGNQALIGAHQDDDRGSASGSAYVFGRNGSVWLQQQKFTASDGVSADLFGRSVSLNGDLAIVSSHGDDDKGSLTGAAYIFARSGTVWSQQSKLTAADAAAGDQFGFAVAASGETVLVGSKFEDTKGADSGSAYVFVRSGTLWSQQQKLTAANGSPLDQFGIAVSISTDTAMVGAEREDTRGSNAGAAYLYSRSGTSWTQLKMLTAADGAKDDLFGHSVAVHETKALVGAHQEDQQGSNSGSAYVFSRSGTNWTQLQKLTAADGSGSDNFGYSVALDTERAVVGAYRDDHHGQSNPGSAYLFAPTGSVWTQRKKLTAQATSSSDYFGHAVGVSGNVVLAGMYNDDDKSKDAGAAIFFQFCDTEDAAKITASDGATSDHFGSAVAMDGDTAVVGANRDDDKGTDSGSAYVFVRNGKSWGQQQKLVASDGGKTDYFGYSVAISGNTAVVGAHREDARGSNAGSAYVFVRTGTSWLEQKKLTAYDGAGNDYFGFSVAANGNTALVGAHLNDDRGGNSGSAYIFMRTGSSWGLQRKLTASDGQSGDYFGASVALAGNTAVIGSYFDDDRGTSSGSAYVYTRSGVSWSIQKKLTAQDGSTSDYFGYSVSVSGDLTLVGAHFEDQRGANSGAAYVFARSGTLWSQQKKLTAQDGSASDNFGNSVAISGGTALVGAWADDDRGSSSGGAYMFKRTGSQWVHHQKHIATDGAANDYYGFAVALSGDNVVVGADGDDDLGSTSGSAYLLSPICKIIPGKKCTSGQNCATGYCVDGVCCNHSCGGGSLVDCEACSKAAGAAKDGTCGVVKSGTTCRASGGACDTAEVCSGLSVTCPSNKFLGPGNTCRASAGTCDKVENCTGHSATCPADSVQSATTTCRAQNGDCDMAETCDGKGTTCPPDGVATSNITCRPSSGGCDLVETCDGASKTCPGDKVQLKGTGCRAAIGACDAAESCDGTAKTCPVDGVQPATVICRKGIGPCDFPERCSGGSKSCPPDKMHPLNTVCRVTSDTCDKAETCNGVTASCPPDGIQPSTTTCRAKAGVCDILESCTGASKACPADKMEISGTSCRAAIGICDASESCSGVSATCPADGFLAKGSVCRAAAGVCDMAEGCTGASTSCPSDIFMPNGSTCMSGSGTCQSGKCLATPDGGVPDAGPDQGADASAEAGTDASSEAGTDAKVEGGAGGDSAVDNGAAADTGAAAEAGAAEAGAGVEAGAAEAGAEAGAAGDGSADTGKPNLGGGGDGGCDCRVGSQDPPPALLWLALVGLIVLRRRR